MPRLVLSALLLFPLTAGALVLWACLDFLFGPVDTGPRIPEQQFRDGWVDS